MPESSRRRDKPAYTPPPASSSPPPSPKWLVPVMVATWVIGLVWLVLYYLTGGSLPVEAWDNWNVLAGFGFLVVGFGLSTQWR